MPKGFDDWLAYRRMGIGGSDAAAVLGTSPFRTAMDSIMTSGICLSQTTMMEIGLQWRWEPCWKISLPVSLPKRPD
nr:YqaJ viral recombinase family protein [uncultured Oscillibacter sp.]